MNKTLILIPLTAIILAGLFFVLRPDSPAGEPKAQTFEVRIADSMNPDEIGVHEGDRVELRVESDTPAEFHIHGYDLEREVGPGETAELSFVADITGRFDIEGHPTDSDEHGDSNDHGDNHSHAGEHDHGDPGDESDGHSHSHGIGALTVLPR